jgi:hypothetical protein
MTIQSDLKDSTTLTPKAAGILTRAVRALIKTDPKGAAELVQDASVDALSKAANLLGSGDDGGTIGVIEDQWSDHPDNHADTQTTGGPGSTAASGNIAVGPGQAASGSGAPAMQATYSRPAATSGVQADTERLGREVMRVNKAMRALLGVQEAQSMQFETIKAALDGIPTEEAIGKAVAEAIAKALPDAIKGLAPAPAAKADDKKDDDDDDSDDKNPFAKATTLVASAREELAKASEADLDGKPKAAARHRMTAQEHLESAEPLVVKAAEQVESKDPVIAKAAQDVKKVYDRLAKAVTQPPAENQDTWPASDPKTVGKAEPDAPDLRAAVDAIGKAAEGMGMLTANVQQVLSALGNSSRNPAGLPPVFSLAKAQVADVDARMAKVKALAEANEITWSDVDATQDAVQRLRMASVGQGMPPAWAQQAITKLPDKVQQILRDAA